MKRSKATLILAPIAAMSLLAACSGPGGSESSNQNKGTETQASGPHGTLTYGVDFKPTNWDPLPTPNTTYVRIPYEGLVKKQKDGITLVPGLATSWDVTPDKVTFTLRQNVTFHDGTPFNADAVIANVKRIKSTPSAWQGAFAAVSSVTADGPDKVVFNLSSPAPDLVAFMAARGTYMVSPKALADGSYLQTPDGTGPWKYNAQETVVGSKYVFDYNTNYWNKDFSGPKKMVVQFISDQATLANAVVSGQVDAASLVPAGKATVESAGMKTVTYPMLRYHLYIYDRAGQFKDVNLRRAVCSAINGDELSQAEYDGDAKIVNQRLPQGSPAYVDGLQGYPFDLAKAKDYMQKAGNPSLSIEFPFFSGQDAFGQVFQKNLEAIGIKVKLVKMDNAQYFSVYTTNKYPLIYNTSTSEGYGPYTYYKNDFTVGGSNNPFNVAPPADLKAAVDKGLAATDKQAAAAAWQDMTKIIDDQALTCGFMDIPGVIAWNPKKVSNVEPTINQPSAFRYDEADVK